MFILFTRRTKFVLLLYTGRGGDIRARNSAFNFCSSCSSRCNSSCGSPKNRFNNFTRTDEKAFSNFADITRNKVNKTICLDILTMVELFDSSALRRVLQCAFCLCCCS